ncbi:MAG: ASCH domain-containing protein [Dehalococcoidales bacterium]
MQNINDKNGFYDIVISIKPIYVDLILDGEKKYEFRKHNFTKPIDKVLIYSTKPIGKIVGYFTVDKLIKNTPSKIWAKCHEFSGISERDFIEYFKGSKTAYAIQIKNVCKLLYPIFPNDVMKGFKAPRSFLYIDRKVNHEMFRNMV